MVCWNVLRVTGSAADVESFRAQVMSIDDHGEPLLFSFRSIIPMPSELMDICTILRGDELCYYRIVNGAPCTLTAEQVASLNERYGAASSREWAVKHWGSFRDAWGVKCVPHFAGVNYGFNTVFPADLIMDAIVERFPALDIEHEWRSQDGKSGKTAYYGSDRI